MSAPEKMKRRAIRRRFTMAATKATDLLAGPSPAVGLEGALNMLDDRRGELNDANLRVIEALVSEGAGETAIDEEADEQDEYENAYQRIKEQHQLLEVRSKPVAEGSVVGGSCYSCSSGEHGKRRYKLPKIEFTKFAGEIREWLPFWNQFAKVHEDPEIDEADKVQYLLQATVSKARKVVEKFPATRENYQKMVEVLKERYGKPELQIEVRIRELLRIVVNAQREDSRLDITSLYDTIDCEMRALDSLHVRADKYAPILYPLVESCLPESLLRLWQRSPEFARNPLTEVNLEAMGILEARLTNLMYFLKREVENEQRVAIAKKGILSKEKINKNSTPGLSQHKTVVSTASALTNATLKCVFCGTENHRSGECGVAKTLTLEDKMAKVRASRLCFICLKPGHGSAVCRSTQKCNVCKKRHLTIMCPEQTVQALCNRASPEVFLRTMRVEAIGGQSRQAVRVLVDSGSSRSYILTSTAKKLGLKAVGCEKFRHGLFGGKVTQMQNHEVYEVALVQGSVEVRLEVLGQAVISSGVNCLYGGPWMVELHSLKIALTDFEPGPIHIVIGSDCIGKIETGLRVRLQCGLDAVETKLGWTLQGKLPNIFKPSVVATTYAAGLAAASVKDLWELDVLGIQDPALRKSKKESAMAADQLFKETIRVDGDGRYEVSLPWLVDHPHLPSNRLLAEKRLQSTLRRLHKNQMKAAYNQVFEEWLQEGIIEVVKTEVNEHGHYLPHHPVIKEDSQTTKIRPVFDASARENGAPSLNDCLEKGLNLIELIPTMLIKFRLFKVGVVADIRKAFLQIALKETDRDVLRFLWVDESGNKLVYRHRRVVFGVNCSPFMLAATINYHLNSCRRLVESGKGEFSLATLEKLAESFYVDNCVTSFESIDAAVRFQEEAKVLMKHGKFDLRCWEQSGEFCDNPLSVLGIRWEKQNDTLHVNRKCFSKEEKYTVTKRLVMSTVQRVFDPLGIFCPVLLLPKLILQELWETKVSWDEELTRETCDRFMVWWENVNELQNVSIPRWFGGSSASEYSLHVFCDASQRAYSAVIYLVVREHSTASSKLVMAKTRVAPLKKLSIPRLELMAATIGSRLYTVVKEGLNMHMKTYFWTDSTTSLAWIQRSEEWAPFVGNRVREIRELTDKARWRHVPGAQNPADLPSRGCSATQLMANSEWWEGPAWLADKAKWPVTVENPDEQAIMVERRKKLVMSGHVSKVIDELRTCYFSKHQKAVRMVAWLFRFGHNCRHKRAQRRGPLTLVEIANAEIFLWKKVQSEHFDGVEDPTIRSLSPFRDETGLIRIVSRISRREDCAEFRQPILLPASSQVVERMIRDLHGRLCHVGTTGLLSAVRERFWVIGGRRAMRSVVKKCVVCQRYASRPIETQVAPLPRDRVCDAAPFEIVGVDFAGPLHLKPGGKGWICIFTCAVYRAVHLELCTSLSSAAFLQVLRRFIARRGRPSKIYSDNGTNFHGVANAFKEAEWKQVMTYTAVERITWCFNPPTAAWWGGFWERLIGMLKQLLRKTLGHAVLDFEEMATVLCDCEAVMNNRPITYVSEDPNDLIALTPSVFLREVVSDAVPDCDVTEKTFMGKRAAYRQRVRQDLRSRFRSEYLGLLVRKQGRMRARQLRLGELVLLGDDAKKRMDWLMGRVEELVPGRDNVVRVARVRTSRGKLLRPVQRIFPLECENDEPEDPIKTRQVTSQSDELGTSSAEKDDGKAQFLRTRLGRRIRAPMRLGVSS